MAGIHSGSTALATPDQGLGPLLRCDSDGVERNDELGVVDTALGSQHASRARREQKPIRSGGSATSQPIRVAGKRRASKWRLTRAPEVRSPDSPMSDERRRASCTTAFGSVCGASTADSKSLVVDALASAHDMPLVAGLGAAPGEQRGQLPSLASMSRPKPLVPRCFHDIQSFSARQRRVPSKLSL